MTQVTIEGAQDLDEAIAATRRELHSALQRAIDLERALALLTMKRLAQAAEAEQGRTDISTSGG